MKKHSPRIPGLFNMLLIVLLLSVCLTGCSIALPAERDDTLQAEESKVEQMKPDTGGDPEKKDKSYTQAPEQKTSETAETPEEIRETEETDETGETEEEAAFVRLPSLSGIYYSLLTRQQQVLYEELYSCIVTLGEDVKVSTLDTDELYTVYEAVMGDHPEIFYCVGYTYRLKTIDDIPQSITFTGKYSYSGQEIDAYNEQLAKKLAEVKEGLPAGAGDYEIARYLYEYVITHTEYVLDSRDNQSLLSALLWGESVCTGYTKAYQYLALQMGLRCAMVTGQAGGGSHAWALVRVEGEYYHVDVTWGDPEFSGSVSGEGPEVGYGYLLITDEEISRNHTIDNFLKLPSCTATNANYFRREGLLFDHVQEEVLARICSDYAAAGKKSIQIKASGEEAYEELVRYLITDGHMFDYAITGQESCWYLTDDVLYTITIELSGGD
ncbi:MAG: hypothetical protein K6A92_09980 [Lachnospiraceae bacterium]|nr:hypothetical protein [Lachnospiraceae bacterium]